MKVFAGVTAAFAMAAGPALAQVAVSQAWVRAPAPGQDTAAAYATLTSPAADKLTGVDASGFGMAMLHLTKVTNGVSSMTDVDDITLPAGQAVALKPGGFHIMLMDAKAAPAIGGTVTLTFHFLHAKDVSVSAPVRPVSARGP